SSAPSPPSSSPLSLLDALPICVVLGGFSAIALLVMMLVINNTFSVLVAQRTRQYALQRVLGATRGQIRKAVLAESVLIGPIQPRSEEHTSELQSRFDLVCRLLL